MDLYLFIPQRIRRIGFGGPESLVSDREKGDEKAEAARQDKYPYSEACPVGIVLKPSLHDRISNGPGDSVSNDDQFREIHREERNDFPGRCP